jgi:hypothetical protein
MLSIAVLFAFGSVATAEDKKPEGTWGKKAEGFDIKVTFKKGDMLTFVMDNGNDKMELEAKCTFEKENVIKCKTTKYTKTGNGPDIKEGFEFSFKFKVDGKKAKMSDIEAEGVDEGGKQLVGGDYEKAAD